MANLKKEELKDILVDVRKSYRLLFKYQRRVLDLVKYIGNYYGFTYFGGYSWFSKLTPRKGKGYLENWSWDWLNMYLYDFHFQDKIRENEIIKFSILIQSDSGYYDSISEEKNEISKTDLEGFIDPREATTRLIIITSKNGWNLGELFHKNEGEFNELQLSKYQNRWRLKNDENDIFAKAYDLSFFLNQEETIRILDEYFQLCVKEDILIKNENEV